MTTTPVMGIVLPTPGGDSGSWDDKINAAISTIDGHVHGSNGTLVTPSGLDIDEDLSFGANGATNVGRVGFTAIAALAAGSKVLFVSSSDNELYWRTNAGTNVKLTSGTSINTTLVGGIVGDYSSVGAEVAYEDSNDRYTFKQQGTKPWARIHSGPVRISEFNTTETVYVELAAAAALASNYTVTLAAALPGSTSLVQISSAGALSYSNTISNALTLDGTVDVNAAMTTRGITLDANEHLTVSGTGDVKHGDRVLEISPWSLVNDPSVGTNFTYAQGPVRMLTSGGAASFMLGIPLRQGDRIKSITYAIRGNVGATGDLTGCSVLVTSAAGSDTSIGSEATPINNLANAWADRTINVTDTTLAAGEVVSMFFALNESGMAIGAIRVTYDRP